MLRDEHDYNAVVPVLDPHPTETHVSIHPNPRAMMLSEHPVLGNPKLYTMERPSE